MIILLGTAVGIVGKLVIDWEERKSKSAHAAREYRGSMCSTGFNSSSIYYMDVGAWAGGNDGDPVTTFGLVSEHDIMICSWLGRVYRGSSLAPDYTIIYQDKSTEISSGARRFLEGAKKRNRGFVCAASRCDKPLTKKGETLVILPDLHLSLYVDQAVDRFCYKPTPESKLTTLDAELRDMLDTAAETSTITIQAGDMYEIWEAEILLRKQYTEFLEMRKAFREQNKKLGGGYSQAAGHAHMIETGRIMPRDFGAAYNHYWIGRDPSTDAVDREGVHMFDTEDIKAGIRRAHTGLFKRNENKLFTWELCGNHDNNLQNPYWTTIADKNYRKNEKDELKFLRRETSPGTNALDHLNEEIGTGDHPIWIEHGSRFDWHNNDRDWWLKNHGFDVVYHYLVGNFELIGKLTRLGERVQSMANRMTDYMDYEMRLPALRAADQVFDTHPNVKLVVTGHTHKPYITECYCRDKLAPTQDGYENYFNNGKGDYWYKIIPDDDFLEKYGPADGQRAQEYGWDGIIWESTD